MSSARRVAARWLAVPLAFGLLAALLWWLPMRWVAALLPTGIGCEQWSGTLWAGGCAGLSIRGSRSGELAWRLQAAPNSLQLPLALAWRAGDSRAQGAVRIDLAGLLFGAASPTAMLSRVEVRELDVSLQTLRNALPANLRLGAVAALEGRVRTAGLQLAVDARQTLQARGELRLVALRLLRADLPLGDFWVRFESPPPPQPARGSLRDLGGPLQVAGNIEFRVERAYVAILSVAARSPAAARALGVAEPFEIKVEGRL